MSLNSEVFTKCNFSKWQKAIILAITAKHQLGIVIGFYQKPSIDSKYLFHWERCNSMVISWLLNACSKEITTVVYFKTAKEVWDELTTRFSQTNGPKMFKSRKKLPLSLKVLCMLMLISLN